MPSDKATNENGSDRNEIRSDFIVIYDKNIAKVSLTAKNCQMGNQIVIGIPGLWKTRNDIVKDIASKSEGLIYAGTILLDTRSQFSCILEIFSSDRALTQAFEVASGGNISFEDLQKISEHTFTLYLVTDRIGIETAKKIMRLGVGLLKAGGLGVKVESAGVAHSKESWIEKNHSSSLWDLYSGFVTTVIGKDYYYTCGMQNFGLADASITVSLPLSEAEEILSIFNYYQLSETPNLQTGHTFRTSLEQPKYRLSHLPYEGYDRDELLNNQWGRWHLSDDV